MAKAYLTRGALGVAMTCTGLLMGCAHEPTTGDNLTSTAGPSLDEFRASLYREPWAGGVYIWNGDEVLADEADVVRAWQSLRQGALAVYTRGGDVRWSNAQKGKLTYCVSDKFGADKAKILEAFAEATDGGWESFADVNFVHLPEHDGNCTTANTAVLFDVQPVDVGGKYLARAFFPNAGRASRSLLLDKSAVEIDVIVPLKNILGHELGHVLGFRHEHTRPEAGATNCFEDNDFRGLTAYDSASVMHYPQCNGTSWDLSFTELDGQGAAALYGAPTLNAAPVAAIQSPADGEIVARSFEVAAEAADLDLLKVELHIDGELRATSEEGPFNFWVSNVSSGEHLVELRATDAKGQATVQRITVTVDTSLAFVLPGQEAEGGCHAGGSGSLGSFGLMLAALLRRRRQCTRV